MSKSITKVCQVCDNSFRARRDAKTCSPACRKRLQRSRSLEQALETAKHLEGAAEAGLERLAAGLLPKQPALVPIEVTSGEEDLSPPPADDPYQTEPMTPDTVPVRTIAVDEQNSEPQTIQPTTSPFAGLFASTGGSSAPATARAADDSEQGESPQYSPGGFWRSAGWGIVAVLVLLAIGVVTSLIWSNRNHNRLSQLDNLQQKQSAQQRQYAALNAKTDKLQLQLNALAAEVNALSVTGSSAAAGSTLLGGGQLSADATLAGNTFNGPNELVRLTADGRLPGLNGSELIDLNAVTLQGNGAAYYTDASNLSSGVLNDQRLSANVALLNANNTFSGNNTFASALTLDTLGATGGMSLCINGSNQLSACGAGPGTPTLQQAYQASVSPQITLVAAQGGLIVQDAATPIGGDLFAIQSNGGGSTYLGVTAAGIAVGGTETVSGLLSANGGIATAGANINAGSGTITGNGSGLTNLNGSSVASGTIANARLSGSGALTVTAGVGLSGGGSVALGGSTTLNVSYGSGANSAVQGNTTLICPSGAGNLGGGGNTITLGTGGTCNNLTITNSPVFFGTLAVQGSGGITIGLPGSTAGSLNLANATNSNLSLLQATAPTGSGTATYSLPAIAGGSSDTICLFTKANCTFAGTAAGGDLTGTYPNPTIAFLQGTTLTLSSVSSGDVLQYNGSAIVNGHITNANLTAGTFSNITGTGALSSGSIASGFGTISTGNNISTTAILQGGTLNATGTLQLNGTNINTAGTLSNVAYLNQNQTFTGTNTFSGSGNGTIVGTLVKNASDSTTAFQVQTSTAGAVLSADTSHSYIGIGTASPNTTLTVYNPNARATQTDLTQNLLYGGLNVVTNFTANAYTPGLFFSTADNNPTSPKGGIYLQETNVGSFMLFGTSSSYATGITNSALELTPSGGAVFQNSADGAGAFAVNNSGGLGQLTVNTSTGVVAANQLAIDVLGSNGGTALCLNGSFIVGGCTANPSGVTLQQAYAVSAAPQIALTAGQGGLVIQDAASPIGGNLFAVQSNGGGTTYLGVTAAGASITGTLGVSSTVNATTGFLLNGTNINTAGTLSHVAYLNQNQTFTGTNTFTGSGNGSTTYGTLLQNASNSTTAFAVQNAAGTNTSDNLLSLSTAYPAASMVSNGSFEVDTTGWQAKGNMAISQVTNQTPPFGSGAMQITNSGTPALLNGAKYLVNMTNGTTYALSFWAKSSGSAFSTLSWGRSDDGATDKSCSTAGSTSTSVWLFFTCTFTAAAQTPGSSYIFIGQNDATARTFFIDGVSLTASSAGTYYTEGSLNVQPLALGNVLIQPSANSNAAFIVANTNGKAGLQIDTNNSNFAVNFNQQITSTAANALKVKNGTSQAAVLNLDTTTANIDTNGSIENSTTGYSTHGSGVTLTADSTANNAYSGANTLGVAVTTSATVNAGPKYNLTVATFPISNTTGYTLSFYAKLQPGVAAFTTLVAGRAEDGATDKTCTLNSTTVLAYWQRYTCSFTTTASSGTPYIFIGQSDAGVAHSYYLDGIQLEAASTVSNYREGKIQMPGDIISPTIFRPQSDSTNSFQIQNAELSTTFLNVDSATTKISLTGQVAAAGGINTSGLTVPSAPTVTPNGGTGSTTYSYTVTALNANGGSTVASSAGTTNTGVTFATLGGSVFNQVTWNDVPGASSYNVYRTVGGTTQGLIGNVLATSSLVIPVSFFNDTGLAAGSAAPTTDTSGQLNATGTVLFQNASNSAAAFQIQNAGGTTLFTADTTSGMAITVSGTSASFASLTLTNTHFKSTQTTAPTAGTPSNCGTGTGPSAAVQANSTDSAGSFRITAGSTGAPTTCDTVISFNKSYGGGAAAPKAIIVTPETTDGGTGTAAARQIYVSTANANGSSFTVKFSTNPANSEVNWFYYWVIE